MLKSRPARAKYVLPELTRCVTRAVSERQQCAAIELSKAFLDHKRIRDALFGLRTHPKELVAADAVAALSEIQPPEEAVKIMGQCLIGSESAAAVDEACAALVRLGPAGRKEMQDKMSGISVARRLWLVGYVQEKGGEARRAWLEMFQQDEDASVRRAADTALQQLLNATRASVDSSIG